MELIIFVIALGYIGYSNWARDKVEKERLELFANATAKEPIDPRVALENEMELPKQDTKDEIVELDQIDPDQLIKDLHENNED